MQRYEDNKNMEESKAKRYPKGQSHTSMNSKSQGNMQGHLYGQPANQVNFGMTTDPNMATNRDPR